MVACAAAAVENKPCTCRDASAATAERNKACVGKSSHNTQSSPNGTVCSFVAQTDACDVRTCQQLKNSFSVTFSSLYCTSAARRRMCGVRTGLILRAENGATVRDSTRMRLRSRPPAMLCVRTRGDALPSSTGGAQQTDRCPRCHAHGHALSAPSNGAWRFLGRRARRGWS